MFYNGTGENGLAIIVDARTKVDRESGGCLDTSRWRHFLGDREWKRTLRVALRDYGTEPFRSKDLPKVKSEVSHLLREMGVTTLLLMQSPAIPNIRQVHSAWNIFAHPGSPYKWAGTVQRKEGYFVCPVLNPSNYEDVYEWLIRRWFHQAHAVARGRVTPMPWPHVLHTTPNTEMVSALTAICENRASPIAVDIETNTTGTIITAIGVSNGTHTVSIPWDQFHISGTDTTEPSLAEYEHGREIYRLVRYCLESVNPKILHNGAFDIYELSKRDLHVSNFEHDTLLMHRVAFPQYRHGLQQAAASLFCVEPWKCLWKPPSTVRGSGEDVWLSDPLAMRNYNGQDAYATWQLYHHLRGKVGV
jgi:hypothetical protein